MIELIDIYKIVIGTIIGVIINYIFIKQNSKKILITEIIINALFLSIYIIYIIFGFTFFLDLFYSNKSEFYIFFIFTISFFILIPYVFFIIKRKIFNYIGIKTNDNYILFSFIYILTLPIIFFLLGGLILDLFISK